MSFESQTYPGFAYTEPVDWHSDPVYRIETNTSSTCNHTATTVYGTGGAVEYVASYIGDVSYSESFGGPHPGTDATYCAWNKAKVGGAAEETWTGICPDVFVPSTTFGTRRGSGWSTRTDAISELLIPEVSGASAFISGWAIRPWLIHSDYDEFMYDDALHEEFLGAAAATRPGDDWSLQMEAFHPFFIGFDVAPDETLTTSAIRSEAVYWRESGPTDWGFYGYDSDGNPRWGAGAPPSGALAAEGGRPDGGYEGGLVDFSTIPGATQPTQIDHISTIGFIEPDDPWAASIPLTLSTYQLKTSVGAPPPSGTGGRDDQVLMLRAAWRLPRFRWFRATDAVTRQWSRSPDGRGLSAGVRVFPAAKSQRLFGGEQ